jgi:hypothetical protein
LNILVSSPDSQSSIRAALAPTTAQLSREDAPFFAAHTRSCKLQVVFL